MSQYDTQSPVLPDFRNDGATNAREISAFVLAEIIKFAGAYALTYLGLMSALYLWAFHSGGRMLLLAVSGGVSAAWGVVVFVLLILFRALLGGVPTIISPQNQGPPMTRRTEIAAFALAFLIVLGILLLLNGLVLPQVYLALGRSLAPLVGFAVSIVGSIAAFILFVCFRQSMIRR